MPREQTTQFQPTAVEVMPERLESGRLYVSEVYGTAIHLCACGCGEQVVTPLSGPHAWTLTRDGDAVTLHPSIGNRFACRSHYWIRRNAVVWA